MSYLRRFLFGRSRTLGLFSDIAMVAAAAARVARRPQGSSASSSTSPVQWLLVGGAALRLLRRIRQVRRNRRLVEVT